jgi:hypothetical protein
MAPFCALPFPACLRPERGRASARDLAVLGM